MNRVGLVGAGKMASAIACGLINSGANASDIVCTCGKDQTGPELSARTGIRYARELSEVIESSEVVLLACKPQQIGEIDGLAADLAAGKLVISILAGTRLSKLSALFASARNIVRSMPNTPGQVGAGITAFASLNPLSASDRTGVLRILGSLGKVIEVSETDLDAVTAVSGSGPAYVFEFCAALEQAAIRVGLSPQQATLLARETVIGAAKLMEATGTPCEELRNNVTSPGGTTAAALSRMASGNLRELIAESVLAAKTRSIQLAG